MSAIVFGVLFIIIVILAATVTVIIRVGGQVHERKTVLTSNLHTLQEGIDERVKVLTELADLSGGLVDKSECDKIQAEVTQEEENLRTEKGRSTITQAELEAVDLRLRELEEIERELESSSLDASRELEMLRSQEREIDARNAHLREQLDSSLIRLDKLLHELASSQGAVRKLTAARDELIETQRKIQFYEQQIATVNRKYMELKRAYDALDIEYAQLYEKHSHG
jgi:chromosome segregation ATPase